MLLRWAGTRSCRQRIQIIRQIAPVGIESFNSSFHARRHRFSECSRVRASSVLKHAHFFARALAGSIVRRIASLTFVSCITWNYGPGILLAVNAECSKVCLDTP